jgi:hypothetical protein
MLRGVARQRRVVAELQVGRDDIFPAIEAASTRQDIAPFAAFLGGLVQDGLEGRPPGRISL